MGPPVTFAKTDVPMDNEARWQQLDADNLVAWPLIAIKAAYVLGVIHDCCESVEWLLKFPDAANPRPWPITYLPAVGICLSSIELLGRCLLGYTGHDGNRGRNLEAGITYLFATAPRHSTPGVLALTQYGAYSLDDLIALRHFTAHGQGAVNPNRAFRGVDVELLDAFPQLIGNALDRYWNSLQQDPQQCDLLGQANIVPLRNTPIDKMWRLFEFDPTAGRYHSITDIFARFDWRVSRDGPVPDDVEP
jgi:hypothetical protein